MVGLSGNAGASPPLGAGLRPCPRAARVQPRGCKGRSPLHKKTKKLPLPHGGRGSGDGGKKLMMWQTQPATETAVPPSGTATAGLSGNAGASPPLARDTLPLPPCRSGSGAGVPGAVAPGEINKKSPPSPWGKGAGGIGAEKQANGRLSRRPKNPATPQNLQRQRKL